MRIPLLLAAALLAALPARAVDIGKASPVDFIRRSRKEPHRLYALIIGATWCHPCRLLSASLAALSASSGTAAGRAAWDMVETDEYGSSKLKTLLSEMSIPEASDLPTVLVLRDGEGLGMSLAGNSVPKLEAFLLEAERQPSRDARPPAKSSMLCPGKKDWASYTLGISGYRGPGDTSTDDFGRKVLLSFARSDAASPGRLFAPPRIKASPGTESANAGEGIFFSASDPLAERATLLEDVSRSTTALAALDSAPGRGIRLILTGHSGEEGMTIGYEEIPWFKDDPTNTYDSALKLTPQDVAVAVSSAARAGKTVRGLITTCYAGRYGDAFMPTDDPSAAPACAAFATLPDKTADGCYSNGYELGFDYASKLLARRSCSSPQDGRALHYSVAVTTTGHDIPMLSSEYFLLYGPGADFLGRGDLAPAPPRTVQRFYFLSDIRVYVDVVSNQVLRAYKGLKRIDPPRLALLDCVNDDYSHVKLDRYNAAAFYLRPHKNGSLVAECTPFVKLYWEPGAGEVAPAVSVFLEPGYGGWSPDDDADGYRKDFDLTGPMITTDGMRPAARVLLESVIPAFSDAGAAKDLGARLDRIVADLRPYDAPLAGALQTLMSEQAGGVERAAPTSSGKDAPPDPQDAAIMFKPAALAPPLPAFDLAALPLDLDSRRPPPTVDASALIAAMLNNLAPAKDEYESALPRLAHVAAAAQAELALIEEAKTSARARRLLAQLETIKACERGLY